MPDSPAGSASRSASVDNSFNEEQANGQAHNSASENEERREAPRVRTELPSFPRAPSKNNHQQQEAYDTAANACDTTNNATDQRDDDKRFQGEQTRCSAHESVADEPLDTTKPWDAMKITSQASHT